MAESPILVIGATGNVGREVVRQMPPDKRLRAAARNVADAQKLLGDGVEYVRFDFERSETFAHAVAGVEKVFLVRPPRVADIPKQMAPFVDAMKAAGVQQVVFLSLLGADRAQFTPHYRIERAIGAAGIALTALRAGFFMQNLSTMHRDDIRLRSEIPVPAGRGKTSFIDVRDIAAVGVRTLTEGGHGDQAYNLTGGESLDYFEVADIFTGVLRRKITYTHPSIPNFVFDQRKYGTPWALALTMVAVYAPTRLGWTGNVTPETERLLGRAPITVRQYVEDYRESWA